MNSDTKLHDAIRDTLWRLYGYDIEGFADAHPVTQRKFNADADSVLEAIEQAGYVLVDAERFERLRLRLAVMGELMMYPAVDPSLDEIGAFLCGLESGDLDPIGEEERL